MDNQSFQKLQRALSPDLQIIIWISNKPLNQSPEYFQELDYFFDQLLSELVLNQQNPAQEMNFIMGPQFGAPLYLLHAYGEKSQKHIDAMLPLLPKDLSHKILYLGEQKRPSLPKHFQITTL